MKIKIKQITKLCIDKLVELGLSQEDADIIVREFLYGELSGKKSHGFATFPSIKSKINPKSKKWIIVKEDDSHALIDAKENLGQLVGNYAVQLAIDKAKTTGISMVGMYNMHSYLMPGYYAKKAAESNMIGIVVDNAPSKVAPFGGIDPKIGTNPIAIAIPTNNYPIVLDMATATRAAGEVRLAEKLNQQLPPNMAIDKQGNQTTNPNKVHALTPLGGYKGFGLGLAIEILAGSMVHAKMGSQIKSGLDRGFLFIVINPGVFQDESTLKTDIGKLVKEIKSCKPVDSETEVRIPGEHAYNNYQNAMNASELEIDDSIIQAIKSM